VWFALSDGAAFAERQHGRRGRQEALSFRRARGGAGPRAWRDAHRMIGISDATMLDRPTRVPNLCVDPSTQEPTA
jgi:hypothetical protein